MIKQEIQDYYFRKDIQEAVLKSVEWREVVPVFQGGKFGSRPGAVQYEKDLEQLVSKGAETFYGSLERWSNPFSLNTSMNRPQLDRLRSGWDLVLDIDCKSSLEHAKKAVLVLLDVLESYEIDSYSLKFSGRRGFHITLPFEVFPEVWEHKPVERAFPELPGLIADYLTEAVRPRLENEFGKKLNDVLEIDRAVITSRHLIRLPYCLHQDTWLASIYLSRNELENFRKKDAEPGNFEIYEPDLSPEKGEASSLIEAAELWRKGREKPRKKKLFRLGNTFRKKGNVPVRSFPPCIKNILAGLKDGRKRSIFLLTTFLSHSGWEKPEIEELLLEWNERNEPPLDWEQISIVLKSQFSRDEPQMAPNCRNKVYYKSMGLCKPDAFCKKVKNPVTYALKKQKKEEN